MSILAVTARVVESARALFEDVDSVGDSYYDFARDLLHVAKNKLDIRYILALYSSFHVSSTLNCILSPSGLIPVYLDADLAIFTEGRSNTGGAYLFERHNGC